MTKYWCLFLVFSCYTLLQALGLEDGDNWHPGYIETHDSLSVKFSAETGFKGKFKVNYFCGIMPNIEGTFPGSLLVQKSEATKYHDYTDIILEKLMPYLKVPREQIIFDSSNERQGIIHEVVYRQEINGISFANNCVYIKFIFDEYEPNYVYIYNRLEVHKDLRKQARISKQAAIRKMQRVRRDYYVVNQIKIQSNSTYPPKPELVYAPHHPDMMCWYAEWDDFWVLLDAASGKAVLGGKQPSVDLYRFLYQH